MASKSARTLSRWVLVTMTGGLGCATGTQGDGTMLGDGGSSASAGTSSSPDPSGTGGEGTAGSGSLGGTGATFGGFANAGTFSTAGTFSAAGTFSTAGTLNGSGGTAGGATGGAAAQGGKGGSAGAAAGSGGKAGSSGTAGAGGTVTSTCGSTKMTISSATGTEERVDLGPEFAIDGDMVTRWASEKSEPQTLDLDLGETVTVNRVVINWEAAYATNYQLQIASNAAGPFTTIYTDAAGNGGTDDVTTLTVSDGRYLRMNGITRKTAYGFSIFEIAVYGDKDETCK
jgi:hypothetical protein